MSYHIDRKMAVTWSRERIREEISDLRQQLADCIQEERYFAQDLHERFAHPLSDPITPDGERQLQEMGQRIARRTEAVRSDIEFLKTLL